MMTLWDSVLTNGNANDIHSAKDIHHLLVDGADDIRQGQSKRSRGILATNQEHPMSPCE